MLPKFNPGTRVEHAKWGAGIVGVAAGKTKLVPVLFDDSPDGKYYSPRLFLVSASSLSKSSLEYPYKKT